MSNAINQKMSGIGSARSQIFAHEIISRSIREINMEKVNK